MYVCTVQYTNGRCGIVFNSLHCERRTFYAICPSSHSGPSSHSLHLILDRKLGLIFSSHDIGHLQAGLLFHRLQPGPNPLFGPILQLADVLGRGIQHLLSLRLPLSPVLGQRRCVLVFELCIVGAEVVCQVRIEVVQADDGSERWGEDSNGKGAVTGEDAAGQRGYAHVEQARRKRFRVRDERLDFTFDVAFDRDPAVDERSNRGARIGREVRDGSSCRTNLTLEFGLHGDGFDFGVGKGIDRKLRIGPNEQETSQ